jgi:SAM-dependent methyltransferase
MESTDGTTLLKSPNCWDNGEMGINPKRFDHLPQLIACPEDPWNNRVFYTRHGKRHWVLTAAHLEDYGLNLAETVQVSDAEIRSYELAGPLPRSFPAEFWINPPTGADAWTLREIATSRLVGQGVEFGAGTSPFPVPLPCEVSFADFVSEDDVRRRKYELQGDDFVRLSYVTTLESPETIPNNSQDFVIAAHVIEHLRDPLKAIKRIHEKLKQGGQFVIVVPDKDGVFDRERDLTSLEHLILDFTAPDAGRDALNYQDFFQHVYKTPMSLEEAHLAVTEGRDCHFHTFTHDSFGELVGWSREHVAPWQSVWSQPGPSGSFEFYFVLRK